MCQSCEALMINGVHCHETGCPDAWRDYRRECAECGCDFRPETREQRYCSPCCAASATGGYCDCKTCEELRHDDLSWILPDGETVEDYGL